MSYAKTELLTPTSGQIASRNFAVAILWSVLLILCWPAIRATVVLGLNDDRYVQSLAAPVLFAFLMYWERSRILEKAAWAPVIGIPLLLLTLSTYLIFLRPPYIVTDSGRLTLAVFASILALVSAFILCFGLRSFWAAVFPLGCLLLMIPVPVSVMDRLVIALQHGSAAASYGMLRLAGIPVVANGTRMSLPGLVIEVAPECSGIRSCLALLLSGLLASRILLRSGWNRLALVAAIIPIAILKNAVRISVLASLGAYVNRAVLDGPIHHYGGLVFTPLAVVVFIALLAWLQKHEARARGAGTAA